MHEETAMREEALPDDDKAGFSLVLGGPLYQLFLRAGLVRNMENTARTRSGQQRVIVNNKNCLRHRPLVIAPDVMHDNRHCAGSYQRKRFAD